MYECIQCGAYFATSSAYTGNTPKCRGCRSAGGNKRKDRKKQADDEERRRRAAEADEERRRWAAAAEAEEERRRVAAEARRARVAAIDKHQRDAHNNSMRGGGQCYCRLCYTDVEIDSNGNCVSAGVSLADMYDSNAPFPPAGHYQVGSTFYRFGQ